MTFRTDPANDDYGPLRKERQPVREKSIFRGGVMNNFDKWKQRLTPEDILTNYGIFKFCGTLCPASNICHAIYKNFPRSVDECRKVFLDWANGEAECLN